MAAVTGSKRTPNGFQLEGQVTNAPDPIAREVGKIASDALSTPPRTPDKPHTTPLKPSPKASQGSPSTSVSSPNGSPVRSRLANVFTSTLELGAATAATRVTHTLLSMSNSRERTFSLSSRLDSSISKRVKETPSEQAAKEISAFFKANDFSVPFHSYAKAVAEKGRATLTYKDFKEKIYPSFIALITAVEDLATLDDLVQKTGDKKKRDAIHNIMVNLVQNFHECGIKGIRKGQEVLFWSGLAAMLEAEKDPNGLSDSGIPLFVTLFAFWKRICLEQEGKRLLGSLLPNLFSYMFARYAHGDVSVRISSASNDTNETCLNANSAFFAVELPTLLKNPKVTKVLVSVYNQDGTWSSPIDFKSEKPEEVARKMALQTSLREGGKPLPLGAMLKFCQAWKQVLSNESSC